jgi:nuclear pore complex protein Nup133
MFSTESAHATSLSLRNPRRRQRTNSDESVKPPKAKRQRSGLRHDTFDAPSSVRVDRVNQATEEVVPPNHGESSGVNGSVATKELVVRGGRKEPGGDRADGTLVLVRCLDFEVMNYLWDEG